jgi:predicted dithiol-disulfide oxidoreductase (DUF899 family)
MTKHKVTTREEWLAIRGELLAKEKELTRRDEGDPPQLWMRRHDEYHETDAAGR